MTNTNLTQDLTNLIEQFTLAECGEAEYLTLSDVDFLIENEDHYVWLTQPCFIFTEIMDFRDHLIEEVA